MANDNTITIVGNTTRDIELRYTDNGKAVCDIGVAINERRKDASGEWVDGDPTFVDVTVWDAMAEHVAASCPKGSRVVVLGRVKMESWEDKETGQKRSKLKMVADEVGASLRWADATVIKQARDTSEERPFDV